MAGGKLVRELFLSKHPILRQQFPASQQVSRRLTRLELFPENGNSIRREFSAFNGFSKKIKGEVDRTQDFQQTLLSKALIKNSHNPRLAWQLFKRTTLTNQSTNSTVNDFSSLQRCLPIITDILIRANMFSEIEAIQHHLLLFDNAPHSILFSIVKILANSGHIDKAMYHFQSLRTHLHNKPPSIFLYNLLIETSLKHNYPDFVSWLYKDMIFAKVKPETYTFNLLITGLCDLGRLEDARELFDKMPDKGCEPNEYSFGILARGYCNHGLASKGLELLDIMKKSGISPNIVIYNTLISSFCKEDKNDEAEKLVDRMKEDNIAPNIVTFNTRISALCKAGKILEASRIFRDMQIDEVLGLPKPNVVTHNLMLEGFCRVGMLEEAKSLVELMKKDGIFSNAERSYNTWLLGLLRNGKILEAQNVLVDDDEMKPNIYSYNIMINGLCKNNMLPDARGVISLMTINGVSPDTVTYTTLLQGYCRKRKLVEANKVLHDMIKVGCYPNTYTCNILLQSLWREGKTEEAEKLLQKMNERGEGLDNVSCNIVIDGLCRSGKVDKAVEIVSEMWNHGSAALGSLGNSYIGLVDAKYTKKCYPDLITYSTVINGLCRDGRLDEAKKKFVEMLGKNLYPDSSVYDIFLHHLCKKGKVSSAFQVLKDMERKGCNKSLRTYNSLINGLVRKSQIFEIFGLMDEMKERGVNPNVYTYNSVLGCLFEGGRSEEISSVFEEMLRSEITPNLRSFELVIKTFCRTGEFRPALEAFEIGLGVCGHKVDVLYRVMFNELLAGGEILEAKQLFEDAVERCFDLTGFDYKNLIDTLCREEIVEGAVDILEKMLLRGCKFDPELFLPVIDYFGKRGNKHEVKELTERMESMGRSEVETVTKRSATREWQNILHRDDASAIVLKTLSRVHRGWGHGGLSRRNEFVDDWDAATGGC